MSTYFFDTSALVKRYHRETGTEIVDGAFDDKNVTKTVSDISVIEFYSAFAKKVRAREITDEDFQVAVRVLAQDIRSGAIELTALNDDDKKEAVILIEKHGLSRNLRTLDAMQMAVLKRLGSQNVRCVYCADRPFAAVIENEGFTVVIPESSI